MRIKAADLILLKHILGKLAQRLKELLGELEAKQKTEREANRRRAEKNRKAGYAWNSSNHPKKSKYSR